MGANGEVRLGSQGEVGTGVVRSDLVGYGPAVLMRTGVVRRGSVWRDKAVMEWNGRDIYGLESFGSQGEMSRAAESTDTAEKAAMRQVCLG